MIEVLNEYTVLTLNNPKQSGHVYFKFFLENIKLLLIILQKKYLEKIMYIELEQYQL